MEKFQIQQYSVNSILHVCFKSKTGHLKEIFDRAPFFEPQKSCINEKMKITGKSQNSLEAESP